MRGYSARRKELVRAVLSTYRVRIPNEYFMGLELCLVHRGSSLISSLLGKKGVNPGCYFAEQELNVVVAPTRLVLALVGPLFRQDLMGLCAKVADHASRVLSY